MKKIFKKRDEIKLWEGKNLKNSWKKCGKMFHFLRKLFGFYWSYVVVTHHITMFDFNSTYLYVYYLHIYILFLTHQINCCIDVFILFYVSKIGIFICKFPLALHASSKSYSDAFIVLLLFSAIIPSYFFGCFSLFAKFLILFYRERERAREI